MELKIRQLSNINQAPKRHSNESTASED